RTLYQVKFGFLSQPERVIDRNNPDLLAGGADKPDLGNTDALVYTRFSADVTSRVPSLRGILRRHIACCGEACRVPRAGGKPPETRKPRTPCMRGNHHGGLGPAS